MYLADRRLLVFLEKPIDRSMSHAWERAYTLTAIRDCSRIHVQQEGINSILTILAHISGLLRDLLRVEVTTELSPPIHFIPQSFL